MPVKAPWAPTAWRMFWSSHPQVEHWKSQVSEEPHRSGGAEANYMTAWSIQTDGPKIPSQLSLAQSTQGQCNTSPNCTTAALRASRHDVMLDGSRRMQQ